MYRHLLGFLFIVLVSLSKAQCPQVYNYLGNLSSNPQFISCTGGAYVMNFQSNSSWGAYTINWGDGSPNHIGASYTANSIVTHTYAATTGTYNLTLVIPANNCTLTGFVAVEQAVFAAIQVAGGVALACAPKTLTFTNVSTFTSATTTYTWNFGDGSPPVVMGYTNAGQNVAHTYNKGTVNCQTQVTLLALNYCTFGNPTTAQVNPLYVYDIDDANITPDRAVRCWPDNQFTFTNSTNRNCVPQGNTFQRQEKWNLGDYWGKGHDSIIDWQPWPPSTPISVTYSSVGTYSVLLVDSNLCGVDAQVINVSIVNPPTASVVVQSGNLCQNSTVSFTNASSTGFQYLWNFGTGGGFVNLGSGNKTFVYNTPGTYTVRLVALIPGGGNPCSDTSSVIVNILAAPVASFAVTPSVGCNAINSATFTDLSTGAVAWNWTFANGNTSTLQAPPVQNYTNTGTFVATLAVTGTTSCVHTRTANIVVRPKPVPNFVPFTACVGASVTFTNTSTPTAGSNSITTYTWRFGDGSPVSNNITPVHTYTSNGIHTVTLITQSAFCIDSITQIVTINVKPTASFVATPTLGCPPMPVSFTNTSSNFTGSFWKFGSGPTATSSAANPTFTFANTTQTTQTYTVTLIVTTGVGCADSIKKPVNVLPKPVANFISDVSAACSPFVASFTNTSTGSTAFTWTLGDGSFSTTTNPSHTYTNTTLFQQTVNVIMAASNNFGCSDTVKKSLIIYAKPGVTVTMVPASGCHPLNVSFPAIPGVATYTWDHGDGSAPLITSQAPHSHTYINTSSSNLIYTVSVIAANGSGCVDSAIGQVTVFPVPVPGISVSPTLGCSPHTVSFVGSSNTNGSSYAWRFGDNQTAVTGATATVSHTYVNPSSVNDQTYTAYVIVTSPNSCKDSISANLLVYYKPVAEFAVDSPKCASKSIKFTNLTAGAASQVWDFGDGSPVSTSVSPVHPYPNQTSNNITFTAQLIVTTSSGCTDTTLGFPVVYAKPVPDFVLTPSVGCHPLNVSMASTSSFEHSYLWKFGDGGTSFIPNASHTYTNGSSSSNQNYNVTLVTYNNNGCRDSLILPILVYAKPFADFKADTPACNPKLITFTNTSIGGNTYLWDFGNGGTSTSNSVATSFYKNINNTTVTYLSKLEVSSVNNCKDTATVPITVHSKPEFFISAQPDSGCSQLNVHFPKINGAVKYNWTFEVGNTSTMDEVTHSFGNTGTTTRIYTVQLIAADEHDCLDTSFKVIKVFPLPIAKFTAAPLSVFIPNQATKMYNLSTGATKYLWDFGDGNTSDEKEPSHRYTKPGEYQIYLIAITPKDCRDTARLSELVLAQSETSIEMPNAFTPNSSGSPGTIFDPSDRSNDIFHPNIKGAEKYTFSVYSRWGELLFETKNPDEGWDGYYKGKICTQDVYIWKVVATFVDGKTINTTGDVLLLR